MAHAFSVLCRAFQPDISESIVNSFPGQSAGPTEGRDFDSPLWPQSVETIVAAAQQTPSTNPYTTQKDLDAGARLYRPLCAGCHGFEARGAAGEGPDIQVGSPGRRTDAEVYETIRDGIGGTSMPGWNFSETVRSAYCDEL